MGKSEDGRHIIDTEQERRAVKLAMEYNASGGWDTYDYTRAPGADMSFPDLDEDEIGNLEFWIIKGKGRGWIDLNEIADGDERRMAAMERVVGIPEVFEDFDAAKEAIEVIEVARDEGDAAFYAKLAQYGVKDDGHFKEHIEEYYDFLKDKVDSAEDSAWSETQDMMDDAMRQQQARQAAAVSADPGLTAAFEGVTIEQWAQASASMLSIQDPGEQARMLAGLGMDRAKYDKANAEFQARMQRDTTGAIATIYGKAFSGAQGVAGGYGMGTTDGSAQQLGGEPVTFEKYSEIAGAQAAWGESGQDVNGMLQQVFGIGAGEVSKYGSYWSTKFAADVKLMMKHAELMEQYKAKYMGGAGGGMDDDLDI